VQLHRQAGVHPAPERVPKQYRVGDATGRVTAFSSAYQGFGSHANYAIGSSQVVQQGIDAETGLVWGRWAGGVATVLKCCFQ